MSGVLNICSITDGPQQRMLTMPVHCCHSFEKIDMPAEMFKQFKPFVTERQVSRLHVVGSSKVTAPLIDASYRRFLSAMESHLEQQPFMLGHRPGACDFALYGAAHAVCRVSIPLLELSHMTLLLAWWHGLA